MPRTRLDRAAGERSRVDTGAMTDNVYRVTEVVGTSAEGVEDAVRKGVRRAVRTLREVDWFEVSSVRGHVENGEVAHFQVGIKIGFRLEE